MTNDFEKLELKIAFLERANNELSDVVYRQQRELDQLRVRVASLVDRVEAIKDTPTEYTAEQEKPPHY
jgi:SlyX protein